VDIDIFVRVAFVVFLKEGSERGSTTTARICGVYGEEDGFEGGGGVFRAEEGAVGNRNEEEER